MEEKSGVQTRKIYPNYSSKSRLAATGRTTPVGNKRKRFIPPLKNVDEVGQNDCDIDLPATQTHTVLSYCEETHQDGSVHWHQDGRQLQSETDRKESIGSTSERCKPHNKGVDSMEESDDESSQKDDIVYELPTKFPCKQKSTKKSYKYDYSFNRRQTTSKGKQRIVKMPVKTGRRDSIKVLNKTQDPAMDLSVFDYQPTPQQTNTNGNTTARQCNSTGGKTMEEKLAIDREVLQSIAKTKIELRTIRTEYRARKGRLAQCEESYRMSVPEEAREKVTRTKRVKPSLNVTTTAITGTTNSGDIHSLAEE